MIREREVKESPWNLYIYVIWHQTPRCMTRNDNEVSSLFSCLSIVIDDRLLSMRSFIIQRFFFETQKNEWIITGNPLKGLNEHQDSIKAGITLSSKSSSTVDEDREMWPRHTHAHARTHSIGIHNQSAQCKLILCIVLLNNTQKKPLGESQKSLHT